MIEQKNKEKNRIKKEKQSMLKDHGKSRAKEVIETLAIHADHVRSRIGRKKNND